MRRKINALQASLVKEKNDPHSMGWTFLEVELPTSKWKDKTELVQKLHDMLLDNEATKDRDSNDDATIPKLSTP